MDSNKKYWKGLEELNNEPEFVEKNKHEFAEPIPIEDVLTGGGLAGKTPRRDFLKALGFGVGAVTLMHERERAGEIIVKQVRIVELHLLRQEESLIDDNAAGEGRDVKIAFVLEVGMENPVFCDLADDVEHAVEGPGIANAFAAANEHLHDIRFGGAGGFADQPVTCRDFAPADQLLAFFRDGLF